MNRQIKHPGICEKVYRNCRLVRLLFSNTKLYDMYTASDQGFLHFFFFICVLSHEKRTVTKMPYF